MLEEDILDVGSSGVSAYQYNELKFTLIHGELETELTMLKEVTIRSDFYNSVSDTITVSCLFPSGDFVYDVLPYKSTLYMNMTCKYIDGTAEIKTFNKLLVAYIENKELTSHTEDKRYLNRDELNKEMPMVLIFSCYDIEVLTMKKINSKMGLKSVTLKQAIQANFSYYIQEAEAKIDDNNLEVKLDMLEPDNNDKITHIYLDQGPNTNIDITTIPFYLQDKYGIYNTGLISYYQNHGEPTVYVRPQLNPMMYDELDKKVDIFIPSVKRVTDVNDKSYSEVSGILKIVSPSIDKFHDDGNLRKANDGGAIAYRDQENLKRASKITIDGDKIVNDAPGYKVQGMGKLSGSEKIKFLGNTTNLYNERTKIIINEARVVPLVWRNSCPFIVQPAMPVKIHYEFKNYEDVIVKTYTGNIAGISTLFTFTDQGIFPNSELIVFLLDEEETNEDDKSSS